MAEARTLTLLQEWHELLVAEQNRRAGHLGDPGGDPRQQLLDQLKIMGERLAAAPGYVPPSPGQLAEWRRDLDRWSVEHGYPSG
jgi:hypothetical protein